MPILKLMLPMVVLAACSGEDSPNTTDATQEVGCEGNGDRFVLDGAFAIDSDELGPVTVEGKVAGFMGAAGGGNVFALTKRHTPLDGDWDAVGEHDISGEHAKYLRFPFDDSSCATPGACSGFFALAGKVVVHAVEPRFLASFELTELFERSDSSDTQGAPIAGTITGCVDSRRDP
jgi:hypothetical protein